MVRTRFKAWAVEFGIVRRDVKEKQLKRTSYKKRDPRLSIFERKDGQEMAKEQEAKDTMVWRMHFVLFCSALHDTNTWRNHKLCFVVRLEPR